MKINERCAVWGHILALFLDYFNIFNTQLRLTTLAMLPSQVINKLSRTFHVHSGHVGRKQDIGFFIPFLLHFELKLC